MLGIQGDDGIGHSRQHTLQVHLAFRDFPLRPHPLCYFVLRLLVQRCVGTRNGYLECHRFEDSQVVLGIGSGLFALHLNDTDDLSL